MFLARTQGFHRLLGNQQEAQHRAIDTSITNLNARLTQGISLQQYKQAVDDLIEECQGDCVHTSKIKEVRRVLLGQAAGLKNPEAATYTHDQVNKLHTPCCSIL